MDIINQAIATFFGFVGAMAIYYVKGRFDKDKEYKEFLENLYNEATYNFFILGRILNHTKLVSTYIDNIIFDNTKEKNISIGDNTRLDTTLYNTPKKYLSAAYNKGFLIKLIDDHDEIFNIAKYCLSENIYFPEKINTMILDMLFTEKEKEFSVNKDLAKTLIIMEIKKLEFKNKYYNLLLKRIEIWRSSISKSAIKRIFL